MLHNIQGNRSSGSGPNVRLSCPSCGHAGTFEQVEQNIRDLLVNGVWYGQRKCPNIACNTHIFYIQEGDSLLESFPHARIDFEKEGVPQSVLATIVEAITCHSVECYTASAIMVRKTLEELCNDRDATGKNLVDRIKSLSTKIILPKELLDSIDDLRLLGNDAAHVESKNFEKVSKDEVEISIELTKEILKSVYQYKNLVAKLQSLKRVEPEASPHKGIVQDQ